MTPARRSRLWRHTLGPLLALAVGIPVGLWGWSLALVAPAPLPPCVEEDSAGCCWDAAVQGNGRGESFCRP